MKIPISISADHTTRFLDYLSISLRSYMNEGSSASFAPDGSMTEKFRITVIVDPDTPVLVECTITLLPDGILSPIVARADDKAPSSWQQCVEHIIREALVSTLNAPKVRTFYRYMFAYMNRGPLEGEYYIRGFRLAPSAPTSPFPFGFGEENLFIDLYAEGADRAQALALGKAHARKIASLLSVFLNIGLYEIPMETRWVYDGEETRCLQLGYKSSIPMPTAMPVKGTECNPGQFYDVNRDEIEKPPPADDPFRCPKDIRHLFRVFHTLSPNDQAAYLGAATMFQLSLTAGRNYPSVQMAYAVAAVDALARGKRQNMKTFIELVREICPEVKVEDVEYLYQKVRSAHFHAGNLPGGEYEPMNLTVGLLVRQKGDLIRMGWNRFARDVMRFVLVQWLLRHDTDEKGLDPMTPGAPS